MQNLAGNHGCDAVLRKELMEAGITVFPLHAPVQSEVPSSLLGVLTKDEKQLFKFHRAWYYWVASGNVPLEVAQELYSKGKVGHDEIRSGGDCGCRPPETWTEWHDELGRVLVPMKQKEEIEKVRKYLDADFFDKHVFVEDPAAVGHGFVTTYHIDSQEGLNLFVKTLREHKLVD